MSAKEWFGRQGGAAFPVPDSPQFEPEHGMSLRDYFAAKAMQAMLAESDEYTFKSCAAAAYKMADAMIAERGKS